MAMTTGAALDPGRVTRVADLTFLVFPVLCVRIQEGVIELFSHQRPDGRRARPIAAPNFAAVIAGLAPTIQSPR